MDKALVCLYISAIVGITSAWRTKIALRDFNRRVYWSNKERAPLYWRPLILSVLIGTGFAALTLIIPQP